MSRPPKYPLRFLRLFCREDYIDEIEGDLMELFEKRAEKSPQTARWKFVWDVAKSFRLRNIRSFKRSSQNSNYPTMFQHYFKISWRNLLKNKGYSFINIGGLAAGMTVVMFIGLWVHDELSFNKYHKNYDAIAQVWSSATDPQTLEIGGSPAIQYPVGVTLKNSYPHYFRHVLMTWGAGSNTLSAGDRGARKKFKRTGQFIEPGVIDMLSLKMIEGSRESLNDPSSIILSKSTAEAIFGREDPMHKSLSINNRMQVQVTGVYENIPGNNRFGEVQFFSTWDLWLSHNEWAQGKEADWDNRPFNLYVQLQPNVTIEAANAAIKDLYRKNVPEDFYKTIEKYDPFVQLIPMSTWHLYGEYKDGKPAAGRITYVWLFGIVGIFVLILACINFINLSTARSEKRSREVGIRKAIGSRKGQLVSQFLSESFMVVVLAFLISIALVVLLQHQFNELADKDIALPFGEPVFWGIAAGFIGVTGFIAGIYPAFYLSSIQPVKALKGGVRSGRFATLSRKMLVVVQFTVSVVLIIGTLVVYQQIQFAQDRPVGYDRQSVITVETNDAAYRGKIDVIRTELLNTGVVSATTASSGPLTAIWNATSGYKWPGKDPAMDAEFAVCNVMPDFGKTVGWEIVDGRDFSSEFRSDSLDAIIVNQAAVRYMGLKDPVGQVFTDVDDTGREKWSRKIIGVVKDMVMESPYEPVRQTLFFHNKNAFYGLLHIKIHPDVSVATALPEIQAVFDEIVPSALFDYKFVDEEYGRKFSQEQRIGSLAGVFTVLAIFISCLGLFGLASYVAEQRTKEIGIRKVLGASVASLWEMMSKEFVVLVLLSFVIAMPSGYYLMTNWLEKYDYRTDISWQVLVLTGMAALLITLLTVSFQAIKAATANPVKSLTTE